MFVAGHVGEIAHDVWVSRESRLSEQKTIHRHMKSLKTFEGIPLIGIISSYLLSIADDHLSLKIHSTKGLKGTARPSLNFATRLSYPSSLHVEYGDLFKNSCACRSYLLFEVSTSQVCSETIWPANV